jgi:hypothetical protein
MAMGSAGAGRNSGRYEMNLRKRICAYASELRDAVSAAMVRTEARRGHVFAAVPCSFEFDDELNGADAVERRDGAAGDDGELGRERGDGDEAEVGAAREDLVRALAKAGCSGSR